MKWDCEKERQSATEIISKVVSVNMSAVLAMSTISLSNRIYSVNLLCEQLCKVFCTCENIQTNNNNKQTTNIKRRKEKTKVAFENVHACN